MKISKTVKYYNFGYLPTGDWKTDIIARFLGHPNLLKRLQAKSIMEMLDVQPGDLVLDFGCGAGFFTVEIAKKAAKAVGLDINPYIEKISIPQEMRERLNFILLHKESTPSSTKLPFESGSVDKILVSDVYVALSKPIEVTQEFHRVLKSGGKLVVVNTLGRIQIKKAYLADPWWFRLMRNFGPYSPSKYDDYVALFFQLDKVTKSRWDTVDELAEYIDRSGFTQKSICYPFNNISMTICYWWQYLLISRGKGMALGFKIVSYYLLKIVGALSNTADPSTVIIIAIKK